MAKEFGRRVPPLRAIEPDLRRARLLGARQYGIGSIPRHAVLNGHFDTGQVVIARLQRRQT